MKEGKPNRTAMKKLQTFGIELQSGRKTGLVQMKVLLSGRRNWNSSLYTSHSWDNNKVTIQSVLQLTNRKTLLLYLAIVELETVVCFIQDSIKQYKQRINEGINIG
jgi:hypothetical protein